MRRHTKIIKASLATITIGSLIAFPVLTAYATDPAHTSTPDSTTAATAPSSSSEAPWVAPSENAAVMVRAGRRSVRPGEVLNGTVTGLPQKQDTRPQGQPVAVLTASYVNGPSPRPVTCTIIPQSKQHTIMCTVPGQQPVGRYRLQVTYPHGNGLKQTVSSEDVYIVTLSDYRPQLTTPSLPINPGDSAPVLGSGFQPSQDNKPSVQITVRPLSLVGPRDETILADQEGRINFNFATGRNIATGPYEVTATDLSTNVSARTTVYVLTDATLEVSQNTGKEGAATSTVVSGRGFSHREPTVKLSLFASGSAQELLSLANPVAIDGNRLPETPVTLPAHLSPGMYRIAAMATTTPLATTWIAVFPREKTTPPAVVGPRGGSQTTVTSLVPAPALPPILVPARPETAATPAALNHRLGIGSIVNPFAPSTLQERRIPDLNASTSGPEARNTVGLTEDPHDPQAGSREGAESPETTGSQAGTANPMKVSPDMWPIVLTGALAILLGLVTGYLLALSGRRRPA